ncbi:hypothetical protein ACHAWC_004749 [Mediolabrus comicus]
MKLSNTRSSSLLLLLVLATTQLRSCFSFTVPKTTSSLISRNKLLLASLSSSQTQRQTTLLLHASTSTNDHDDDTATSSSVLFSSERRRSILQTALLTASPLAITASTAQSASAASSDNKPPPIIPLLTTAKRLRSVPLFAIVDGTGTPFHTYDKDSAGGFGYFFTSYTSAEYVLDDAKKAYEKAKLEAAEKNQSSQQGTIGEDGSTEVPDAWGQAQIVTVPLDIALQLSVKKTSSIAQNAKDKKFNTYYQVIPSTEDLNAALRIENGPRYSERGRVPLFYIDGLTLPAPAAAAGEEGMDDVVTPVYFRIKDLTAEYMKQHPNTTNIPKIRVRELNETFRAMITPGGKDTSLKNLVFVANPDSVVKAKGCTRNYKLGQMILTK